MKTNAAIDHEPTESEIRHQAFLLWLEGGCEEGTELDDWHTAKELLRHRHGRLVTPSNRTSNRPAQKKMTRTRLLRN